MSGMWGDDPDHPDAFSGALMPDPGVDPSTKCPDCGKKHDVNDPMFKAQQAFAKLVSNTDAIRCQSCRMKGQLPSQNKPSHRFTDRFYFDQHTEPVVDDKTFWHDGQGIICPSEGRFRVWNAKFEGQISHVIKQLKTQEDGDSFRKYLVRRAQLVAPGSSFNVDTYLVRVIYDYSINPSETYYWILRLGMAKSGANQKPMVPKTTFKEPPQATKAQLNAQLGQKLVAESLGMPFAQLQKALPGDGQLEALEKKADALDAMKAQQIAAAKIAYGFHLKPGQPTKIAILPPEGKLSKVQLMVRAKLLATAWLRAVLGHQPAYSETEGKTYEMMRLKMYSTLSQGVPAEQIIQMIEKNYSVHISLAPDEATMLGLGGALKHAAQPEDKTKKLVDELKSWAKASGVDITIGKGLSDEMTEDDLKKIYGKAIAMDQNGGLAESLGMEPAEPAEPEEPKFPDDTGPKRKIRL